MIRVVVDPGVFVSALIGVRGGAPDIIMRAFLDERLSVVASPLVIEELERVLLRPKFARYASERTRREFVERIRRGAEIDEDPTHAPPMTRDTNDDYLVALADATAVDAIVSGDHDLLDAALDVPVWSPRQLADRLTG